MEPWLKLSRAGFLRLGKRIQGIPGFGPPLEHGRQKQGERGRGEGAERHKRL